MAKAKGPPPYFNFYVEDFLTGVLLSTDPLTDAEIAIYVLLMCAQWRLQGPIADDPKELKKWCGWRDIRAIGPVVERLVRKGKIIREGGVLYNRRMQKEIAKHAKWLDAQAGKKSGSGVAPQPQLPLLSVAGGNPKRGLKPMDSALATVINTLGERIRGGR